MKLHIVNYGSEVTAPDSMKREDNDIVKKVKAVAEQSNMGKGAVIVSEVMHTGLPNLNFRRYRKEGIGKATQTFYTPYYTPFLMHHESGGGGLFTGGDPNLISIGANIYAKYSPKKTETYSGMADGYIKVGTFISDTASIGGQNAIEAIQSRQILTLSIGSKVSDENYRCSICGVSRYGEDSCDHVAGQEYDGEISYHDVFSPWFKEYSAVYKPADVGAIIRRMDIDDAEGDVNEEVIIDQQTCPSSINIYEIMGEVYPVNIDIKNTDTPVSSVDDSTISINPNSTTRGNTMTVPSDQNKSNLFPDNINLADLMAQLIGQVEGLEHKVDSFGKNNDKSSRIIEALSIALRYNIEQNILPDVPDETIVPGTEPTIPTENADNNIPDTTVPPVNDEPVNSEENTEGDNDNKTEDNNDQDNTNDNENNGTTSDDESINDEEGQVNVDAQDDGEDNKGDELPDTSQTDKRVSIADILKAKRDSKKNPINRKPFHLTSISDIVKS